MIRGRRIGCRIHVRHGAWQGPHGYWSDPRPETTPLGSEAPRRTTPFAENIVLRAGVYYLALLGGAAALWYLWPHAQAAAPSFLDSQAKTASELGPLGAAAAGGRIARNGSLALTVSLAMTAAVLLSLPVAWVYRLTRSKRGYQQS